MHVHQRVTRRAQGCAPSPVASLSLPLPHRRAVSSLSGLAGRRTADVASTVPEIDAASAPFAQSPHDTPVSISATKVSAPRAVCAFPPRSQPSLLGGCCSVARHIVPSQGHLIIQTHRTPRSLIGGQTLPTCRQRSAASISRQARRRHGLCHQRPRCHSCRMSATPRAVRVTCSAPGSARFASHRSTRACAPRG